MSKILMLLCLLMLPIAAATPDGAIPEGYEHWTPASLEDAAKVLSIKAAADPHHSASKQLSDYTNEYFLLGHREGDGQVGWHETQADIFVVESGSATLVVGGTQVSGETTSPHEKRGGTIEGGVRQKLSAGDVVRIPAKVPHQLLVSAGQKFTYFVVKIKGY